MLSEILVRSPFLAEGYHENLDLTSERFLESPFTGDPVDRLFKTGDLGFCDDHGEVTFVGRVDREVKINGSRIELDELEVLISEHASVNRVAVTLSSSPGRDPRLEAFLTLRQGQSVTNRDLRTFIADLVAPHALPS